jgi:hypothetical protein
MDPSRRVEDRNSILAGLEVPVQSGAGIEHAPAFPCRGLALSGLSAVAQKITESMVRVLQLIPEIVEESLSLIILVDVGEPAGDRVQSAPICSSRSRTSELLHLAPLDVGDHALEQLDAQAGLKDETGAPTRISPALRR